MQLSIRVEDDAFTQSFSVSQLPVPKLRARYLIFSAFVRLSDCMQRLSERVLLANII